MIIKSRKIIAKFRANKVTVIITSVSLLIFIIISASVFFSVKSWNDYETNYNKFFHSTRLSIDDTIVKTSIESTEKPADKLDRIIRLKTEITEKSATYCYIAPLVEWQKIIKQYDDKLSNCNNRLKKLTQFLNSLDKLTVYSDAEQSLSAIIQQAIDKTEKNNQADKWKDIEAFWRQSIIDTNLIEDIKQFKEVKLLAVNKLTSIADAWKNLSDANNIKDRLKFDEADSNLSKAYAALSDINDFSQSEVIDILADLDTSYHNL